MNKIYEIFVIVLLFSSCSKSPKPLPELFIAKPIPLQAESISLPANALINPFNADIVDTLAIVYDRAIEYNFKLFDLQNQKLIKTFGRIGRGPNEMSFPMSLAYHPQKKALEFITFNPQRFCSVSIERLLAGEQDLKILFEPKDKGVSRLMRFGSESNYFFACSAVDQFRFALLDSTGKTHQRFGTFDELPDLAKYSTRKLCDVFQKQTAAHPIEEKIVVGGVFWDELLIFELRDSVELSVKLPGVRELVSERKNGWLAANRKSKQGIRVIKATNDYVFVLYSDKNIKEHKDDALRSDQVLVFDWELNPITKLKLAHSSSWITISSDEKYLYANALSSGNIQLVKYKLPDF